MYNPCWHVKVLFMFFDIWHGHLLESTKRQRKKQIAILEQQWVENLQLNIFFSAIHAISLALLPLKGVRMLYVIIVRTILLWYDHSASFSVTACFLYKSKVIKVMLLKKIVKEWPNSQLLLVISSEIPTFGASSPYSASFLKCQNFPMAFEFLPTLSLKFLRLHHVS